MITVASLKEWTAHRRQLNSAFYDLRDTSPKMRRQQTLSTFCFEIWIVVCDVNTPSPTREVQNSKNDFDPKELARHAQRARNKNAPRRGTSKYLMQTRARDIRARRCAQQKNAQPRGEIATFDAKTLCNTRAHDMICTKRAPGSSESSTLLDKTRAQHARIEDAIPSGPHLYTHVAYTSRRDLGRFGAVPGATRNC